ncbi:hypothetical protein BXZ70DRAFT_954171 [Cristinia sonorae]|uniref:F-box domain-containing protein n=1 Tax=Cristinia sonorae TaxID=1940300 RepID=A0A8K0UHU4_9AGAR|nr:hypothetical protein BXZ70DRAFT_954171 [Cristinia sonorae]
MAVTFLDIPPEVFWQITLELDPLDVARLSQTNTVIASYIYDPANQLLWRNLYLAQLLDDPRECIGPLGEPPKQEVDWKSELKKVIRAKVIVNNPGVCREHEGEETVRNLLHLATHVLPNRSVSDSGDDGEVSGNLAWLASLLRGGKFFDHPQWSVSPKERALRAQLHTLFGLTADDFRPPRRVESRGFVYAMRNYKEVNDYGPFLMDGSGRVNWEHILYIQHCISMHLIPPGAVDTENAFSISPLSLPFCQSVIPRELNLDTVQDWAGVEGGWHCSFAFCDHRELLVYNNFNESDELQLQTEIFTDPSFMEAFRTLHITVKVTATVPDPEHPTRPKIMWEGRIGGTHMMSGWVKVTPDGHIRWHFVSGEPGLPMWSSEGIQVGGVRSPFGVLGVWTTVSHDLHDPVGPFWMRKVRHEVFDFHEDDEDGF